MCVRAGLFTYILYDIMNMILVYAAGAGHGEKAFHIIIVCTGDGVVSRLRHLGVFAHVNAVQQ